MRLAGLTLSALLLTGLVSSAQAPPAANPKLNGHLAAWSKTMTEITGFNTKLTLTRKDAAFDREQKFEGSLQVLKPTMAKLKLVGKKPDDSELYLSTGAAVYVFDGTRKVVTEYKVAAQKPGDNPVLDLLGGMPAAALQNRFDITLVPAGAQYVVFDIKPKVARDRQEFDVIRVALSAPPAKSAYLPVQVQLKKPNGDLETWKFDPAAIEVNPPALTKEWFQFNGVPKGWTLQKAGGP